MFELAGFALVSRRVLERREEHDDGVLDFSDRRHLPFLVATERNTLAKTFRHGPYDSADEGMTDHHRHNMGEGIRVLSRGRQPMRQATKVLQAARMLRYLPPRRLAVVVLVNVPERVFTLIRTVTHHITDVARTAGDNTPTEITAVVFPSFVDPATPAFDQVSSGFRCHHSIPFDVKNVSGTIVRE